MKKYLNKEFLLNNRKIVIKAAVIAAVAIAAVFMFISGTGEEKSLSSVEDSATSSQKTDESSRGEVMIIDVSGAVNHPSVVELSSGSRVGDAIDAAGGLAENADISQINRAALVSDGEKIYIPSRSGGDETPSDTGNEDTSLSGTSSSEKVNINTASSAELQTLNGVGPVTAEKIIEYRESSGRFSRIEDIKKVSGIGDKTYEKLKAYISI